MSSRAQTELSQPPSNSHLGAIDGILLDRHLIGKFVGQILSYMRDS